MPSRTSPTQTYLDELAKLRASPQKEIVPLLDALGAALTDLEQQRVSIANVWLGVAYGLVGFAFGWAFGVGTDTEAMWPVSVALSVMALLIVGRFVYYRRGSWPEAVAFGLAAAATMTTTVLQ